MRSEDSDGRLAWQRAKRLVVRWLAGNGAAYSHHSTASGARSLIVESPDLVYIFSMANSTDVYYFDRVVYCI